MTDNISFHWAKGPDGRWILVQKGPGLFEVRAIGTDIVFSPRDFEMCEALNPPQPRTTIKSPEVPERLWAWPDGAYTSWYSGGCSTEVNLGLSEKQNDEQSQYVHESLYAAQTAEIEECHKNINLKADFIEKTINDCAAKDAEIEQLRESAERWDALMASQRIRLMGRTNDLNHVGIEFWVEHDASEIEYPQERCRTTLVKYVDRIRDA